MKLINLKISFNHTLRSIKRLNEITVCINWKKNELIVYKISVPCTVTCRKQHMFKPDMVEIPEYVEVSSNKFLDIVNRNCVYNIIANDKNTIFISYIKDITLTYYMKLPRSMLCRKFERNHFEQSDHPPHDKDFDYNFLPNCFMHINT